MRDEASDNDLTIPEEVLTSIRQITQAIDLHSRYLIKNYGVTGPQLMILQIIQKHGLISVSAIAKNTSISISTVTGILVRLEKQHLIQRVKNAEDKRKVMVDLTEKGKSFLLKAPESLQKSFLIAFNQLKKWEKLMILSSLQRLVSLMQAEGLEVSPVLATGPIDSSLPSEEKFALE
jgi:DNA-binding MarR family transcriptional regulator